MNTAIVKAIGKTVKRYAPHILTAFGISGIFATAISAGHATIKACEIIEEEKGARIRAGIDPYEMTAKEKVKLTWKLYIPTVTTALLASSSVVAANCIMCHRNAALATSASLAVKAYKDYKESTKSVAGEEIAQKIQDDISQKKLENADFSNVIDTRTGNTLCYEPYSGRVFLSSVERLRHVENILASRMLTDMWITLNDYYYELGLEQVHPKLGDKMGWHIQDGMMEFNFSSKLTSDDKPCIVINTHITPEAEFMLR